jgi:hypothetical protein
MIEIEIKTFKFKKIRIEIEKKLREMAEESP